MSQLNNMINDSISSISKLIAPTNTLATADSNKVDDEDDHNHDGHDSDDIQCNKRIKKWGKPLHPVWPFLSNVTDCHLHKTTVCIHCENGVNHGK